MNILGINSVFHETAASLLTCESIFSIEEERFTGIRHGKEASPYGSWLLPFHSINYCLKENDLTLEEIDHIAYSFNPWLKLKHNLPDIVFSLLRGNLNLAQKELAYYYFNKKIPEFLIKEAPRDPSIRSRFILSGEPKWKFHFVGHHIAHAASSFFVSPFEEAALLSIDGIGETTCTFLGIGYDNRIKKIKEINYPHSLGFFYEEITKFLGFQRNHDEYKVMALAAYGTPKYCNELRKLVALKPEGDYRVNIDFRKGTLFGVKELHAVLGSPRIVGGKITERHADIAASAQKILEDTVLHVLSRLYKQTKTRNLCMAGGVALNCVMNERIRNESPFENIFIQPAANDAGTALGAALWINHAILNKHREYVMKNVYLGPEFSDFEIEAHLISNNILYQKSLNVARDSANLIANGKVIGWFQGRMEFGPRALGNRSILADPRDPSMKNKINRIKGREEFRPVAPSILEEETGNFFESSEPSPFMLFVRKVKPSKTNSIPAAVHIDGTARLQTVSRKQNALFYELIKEFYLIAGIPVVINTSLNYKGKPIVCTIEQAIECFYNSGLDYMVLGNCIISKDSFKKDGRDVIIERSENLALQR